MKIEIYGFVRHGEYVYRWRIIRKKASILGENRIVAQGTTFHDSPDRARAEIDEILDFLEARSRERAGGGV